ncbi:MAG: hypothetical protein LBG30_05875 [Odoribacteraceae bacterium]|jgi:uncharacterized protein YlxW (UPF0749 family)|nr:hypothetical protein [Odoribacteraceae bacterium]
MTKENIIISELNDKVGRLVKSYAISRGQNRDLKIEVSRLQQQVKELEDKARQLEEEVKALDVACALSAGTGGGEARAQIGLLVREIDECIALLNN